MASYQKVKNKDGTTSYKAAIRVTGHPTMCKSFASKAAAKVWVKENEPERGTSAISGMSALTFGDILRRYAEKVSTTKKGCQWEHIRIRAVCGDPLRGIKGDPIADVRLKNLSSQVVAEWRDRRLDKVSAGSVNREWTLLSSACSVAITDWGWKAVNPFSRATGSKRPKEPKHRTRVATDDELNKIYAAVETDEDREVVRIVRWAVETAMRSGEILTLTPDRVDTETRVARLIDTWDQRSSNNGEFVSIKTGNARDVPLSAEAVRIWNENGGKGFGALSPMTRDIQWRSLRDRAGVKGLHFHDLRHTAITRLAKKLQVLDLARMTGHTNINELMTYYNESAADIAKKL